MTLFENIDLLDDTKRVASRKCVAVAHKRAQDKFSVFLTSAKSEEDFKSRLALVEDEVRELVDDACEEFGVEDKDNVLAAITSAWNDLDRGPDGKWTKKSPQENSQDINDSLEEAPSAIGVGAEENSVVASSDQPRAGDGKWTVEDDKDKKDSDDDSEHSNDSSTIENYRGMIEEGVAKGKSFGQVATEVNDLAGHDVAHSQAVRRAIKKWHSEKDSSVQKEALGVPPFLNDSYNAIKGVGGGALNTADKLQNTIGDTASGAANYMTGIPAVGEAANAFAQAAPGLANPLNTVHDTIEHAPGVANAIGDAAGDLLKGDGNSANAANPQSPDPSDLHHQFSEYAQSQGLGQSGGYDPSAHTQDIYNDFAKQQGMDPSQVQQGLQQYYQGQQNHGLSQGNGTAAQMAAPRPAPTQVNTPQNQLQSTPPDPRDPASLSKGSRWVLAEALETVDLMKGGETPSPKIDKGKAGNQEFINAEMPGSPHPTKHVDIATPIDYTKDFLEGTKSVTEHQDVTKTRSPELNPGTQTWNKSNGTNPVTSATIDPDKNPIRDLMENDLGGFVPENVITAAMKEDKND